MKIRINHTIPLATLALLMFFALPSCRRAKYEAQYESESLSEALSEILALEGNTQAPDTNVIGVTPTDTNVIGVAPPDTNVLEVAPPETMEPGIGVETSGEGDTSTVEIPGVSETGTAATSDETDAETNRPIIPPYTGTIPSDRGFRLEHIIKEGDVGYYEGKTLEELADMFTPNGGDAFHSFCPYTIVTPTGAFVMDNANGNRCYYNKMTGNSSPFCPDPLCDPSECMIAGGSCPDFMYIGADHFYFEQENQIYRCDSNRYHVEWLMKTDIIVSDSEWVTDEDGSGWGWSQYQSGFENIVYARGDTVYMTSLIYQENDVGVQIFGKFDCVSKTFTPFPASAGLNIAGVSNGDTVWSYKEHPTGKIEFYRSDLEFTNVERVTELEDALMENYEYAGYDRFFDDYVYVVSFKGKDVRDTLYNYKTGQIIHIPAEWMKDCRNAEFSDKYVYYTRKMTEEEIQASPLQDYFRYDEVVQYQNFWDGSWATGHATCLNTEGGRVYRRNLETGEEELVLELTYNDVPVWVYDLVMDGNACYITYATYENFNNYYNKTHYLRTQPETFSCAVADLSNGTLRFVQYLTDEE